MRSSKNLCYSFSVPKVDSIDSKISQLLFVVLYSYIFLIFIHGNNLHACASLHQLLTRQIFGASINREESFRWIADAGGHEKKSLGTSANIITQWLSLCNN
jgi:hypothetical protein